MMGLEVNVSLLIKHLDIIFLAFLAVLTSRAISVFIPIIILKNFGQFIPIKEATIIWWGGLRGALSMVLVLSLPDTLQAKELLVTITFGVVVLSITIQGILMRPLLKILKLISHQTFAMSFICKNLARLKAIKAQKKILNKIAPYELLEIKKLIFNLENQKNNILKIINKKKHDVDFVFASKKRIKNIENQLLKITVNSYRNSVENNIITEHEANNLISELDIKE
jgi:hypothetical protein